MYRNVSNVSNVKTTSRWLGLGGGILFSLFAAGPASAVMVYSDTVTNLLRGDTTVGNFAGYYGGSFPGAYPVELTPAEAANAVLGAPDTRFLSLPGGLGVPGSGWPYAYVEVAFSGMTFDSTADLVLTELGNSAEAAIIWLWNTSGGFYQETVTRGIDDTIVIDLDHWASYIPTMGEIRRVGIGGRDLAGASFGFDLDAIGFDVVNVPEPSTLALMGLGLLGLGWSRRRPGRGA